MTTYKLGIVYLSVKASSTQGFHYRLLDYLGGDQSANKLYGLLHLVISSPSYQLN